MDLAKLYDNRAAVPEHPAIIAGWGQDAEVYRATANGESDLGYGARPRNRFDLFHPQTDNGGPLIVFIHGGYWRSMEKSSFSHLAQGATAHGFTVAVPDYTLCPEVTVIEIVDEMRQCCLFLWQRYRRPLIVAGHSAGGHLAACMAATNWQHYEQPRDLVRGAFALSGIFDLRPLLATPLNADLRLDAEQAIIASPLFWPLRHRFALEAWVGGDETAEFFRQSATLAAAWIGLGLDVHYRELAGANHFSIVGELARPESEMTRRLAAFSFEQSP